MLTHVSMSPEGSSKSMRFLVEAANHVMVALSPCVLVMLEAFWKLEAFERLVLVTLMKAVPELALLGSTRYPNW